MIAYRAEIWCDGNDGICDAGNKKGTPHNDHTQLPGLAENLEGIRRKEGWVTSHDGRHWCPKCAKAQAKARKKARG